MADLRGAELGVREHPGDTAAAQRYLQEQVDALAVRGIDAEPLVLHGNPAEEILAAAREQHAGLLVMTSHGHGGILSRLHGSTAEAVLIRAEYTVPLVRPRGAPDGDA